MNGKHTNRGREKASPFFLSLISKKNIFCEIIEKLCNGLQYGRNAKANHGESHGESQSNRHSTVGE